MCSGTFADKIFITIFFPKAQRNVRSGLKLRATTFLAPNAFILDNPRFRKATNFATL
jgi:hypothetical protein